MSRYTPRPWVAKFESGEYLSKWKGFSPAILGCTLYSEYMQIGEEKFFHCVGEFNGIGDVDWWIKEELDKLSVEQTKELELICNYKTYLKNSITIDLIKQLSNFFGLESFHIYRTKQKNIAEFLNQINSFANKIYENSKGDSDEKFLVFKENKNRFKIHTFEEYKLNLNSDKDISKFSQLVDEAFANYKRHMSENLYETRWCKILEMDSYGFSGRPYTREEFIDACEINVEMSDKWKLNVQRNDLKYEERYKLWFENNYETGMEPNPSVVPDFDDPYYYPTPTRLTTISYNGETAELYD